MKFGIIGCGNIGTEIALFIDKNKEYSLDYVYDVDAENIKNLFKKLKKNKPKKVFFDELIKKSDVIIEAANKDVALKLIEKTINKKKKIIIMSTGGLISCLEDLDKTKSEIYSPSGAICGLDGIKSASVGKIKSLTLTTTKPVKGLNGAPYILNNNIDVKKIKFKKIIFNGRLNEAISGFPKNVNVAATLFLASGFKGIKVKIIADPKAKKNIHEIKVIGEFGKFDIKIENVPSNNPKTSYLAILSAKKILTSIFDKVKIGN